MKKLKIDKTNEFEANVITEKQAKSNLMDSLTPNKNVAEESLEQLTRSRKQLISPLSSHKKEAKYLQLMDVNGDEKNTIHMQSHQ